MSELRWWCPTCKKEVPAHIRDGVSKCNICNTLVWSVKDQSLMECIEDLSNQNEELRKDFTKEKQEFSKKIVEVQHKLDGEIGLNDDLEAQLDDVQRENEKLISDIALERQGFVKVRDQLRQEIEQLKLHLAGTNPGFVNNLVAQVHGLRAENQRLKEGRPELWQTIEKQKKEIALQTHLASTADSQLAEARKENDMMREGWKQSRECHADLVNERYQLKAKIEALKRCAAVDAVDLRRRFIEIARLNEVLRTERSDAEHDYKDMRKFQEKFIKADQELSALREVYKVDKDSLQKLQNAYDDLFREYDETRKLFAEARIRESANAAEVSSLRYIRTAVDLALARRPALDEISSRVDKILKAIEVAKEADGFRAELEQCKHRYDDSFQQLGVKSLAELVEKYDSKIAELTAELSQERVWLVGCQGAVEAAYDRVSEVRAEFESKKSHLAEVKLENEHLHRRIQLLVQHVDLCQSGGTI